MVQLHDFSSSSMRAFKKQFEMLYGVSILIISDGNRHSRRSTDSLWTSGLFIISMTFSPTKV